MNFTRNSALLAGLVLISGYSFSQSLDDLMNQAEGKTTDYTTATFKGTRILHGHSIEAPAKGVMQSMFSHRFGTLQDPLYTFLGMNQASIRFGFDYGIRNRLAVGLGRSSGLGGTTPPPTYDFYAKYRLVTQSTGKVNMPVSISAMVATAINTQRWPADGVTRIGADRFTYTSQLLIARKFNERLSLQLTPTFLHRNLTDTPQEKNNLMALGIGGRIKVSKRSAITFETYLNKSNTLGAGYYNPVAIGYDIDTGGHVFQIMLTNSTGLIEPQFIGLTSNRFFDGPRGMRIGFNFSRVFTLKHKGKS